MTSPSVTETAVTYSASRIYSRTYAPCNNAHVALNYNMIEATKVTCWEGEARRHDP